MSLRAISAELAAQGLNENGRPFAAASIASMLAGCRGRGAVRPARVTPWGELTRSPTMRDFLTLKKRLVHNIQATDHWVNGLLS